MASLDLLSRLPVGSSAMTMAGRPSTALATATLCRSPPESLLESWLIRWPRPTLMQGLASQFPAFGRRHPGVEQTVGDVVQRRVAVQQMELLEDEADVAGPHRRQVTVGQLADVVSGHVDLALGGPVERPHHVQQRALAGSRWTDHADQFAGRESAGRRQRAPGSAACPGTP